MSQTTPEYYGDVFHLTITPWDVAVTFGLGGAKPGQEGQDVCVIRMSHQTAKAIAMMVRRTLKKYERDTGVIVNLPREVMNQLGLAQEDW